MKKNIFLKSTFILVIGGFVTKLLGLFVKVLYTRILSRDAINLYSILMPSYSLLLALASFNIQLAVSKRISSSSDSKKTIINSLYIVLFIDVVLILLFILFSNFICLNLLKTKEAIYPLIAICLTLPFVSIGYVVKGYFYGKQNVLPHMVSNVLEQILRLLLILLLLKRFIKYGYIISLCIFILLNILSESFSIFILYLFLPNKINIKEISLSLDKREINQILSISVPSISGRLLCNIGYFFEPIILTNILLYKGFSSSYILNNYGAYNTFALNVLLFPSFFIGAIGSALMPEISRLITQKNYPLIKKRIKEAIFYSLVIGIVCTTLIYIFADKLLMLLYKTTDGIEYVRVLAPFFILFYLESPISSTLIGLSKIKISTFISIIGMIIKLISLIIFSYLGFGIYALVISEIINIVVVTFFSICFLLKFIKNDCI